MGGRRGSGKKGGKDGRWGRGKEGEAGDGAEGRRERREMGQREEEVGRRGEGNEGGKDRTGAHTNSTRFLVSIAFSSFSGPGLRWETTALRLSWRLRSHTRLLSKEQEVPLS